MSIDRDLGGRFALGLTPVALILSNSALFAYAISPCLRSHGQLAVAFADASQRVVTSSTPFYAILFRSCSL
jgi:hypothetical protein